jgi:hypothetical protein
VSVFLSVAPPDGFTRWGDPDWERWLHDHPWESAGRLCSRGDWAVFLYQLRGHCPRARKSIERLMEQLVNERPLTAQQTRDLSAALDVARGELDTHPAEEMKQESQGFGSAEDLDAMIAAARARAGKDPTLGDVWADLLAKITKLLDGALEQKRGIYFGNV